MDGRKYCLKQVEVRLKLKEAPPIYSERSISSTDEAVDVMRSVLAEMDREYLCVVNLDAALHPINFNVVSIGSINQALVPVQNVFKAAILGNAAVLILFHNHPSGDLNPTMEDIAITKRLAAAGHLMDITVLDHIIVGGRTGAFYSFKESMPSVLDSYARIDEITSDSVGEGKPEVRQHPRRAPRL